MQKAPPGNGTLKISGNINTTNNKPVSCIKIQPRISHDHFFGLFLFVRIATTTSTTTKSTIFIKYPDPQVKQLSTIFTKIQPAAIKSSIGTARTLFNRNNILNSSTRKCANSTPSFINIASFINSFKCSSIRSRTRNSAKISSRISFKNSK